MIVSDNKGIDYAIYDDKDGKTVITPLRELLQGGNDNDNKYCYYHCVMTNNASWKCEERYKMTTPGEQLKHVSTGIHPANITKCIPVSSYIPKVLHPLILKYECIPKVSVLGDK